MAAMVQDPYNSTESDDKNEMLTPRDLIVGLVRAPLHCCVSEAARIKSSTTGQRAHTPCCLRSAA